MASKDVDQPIRILHLSDVHFKASKAWDQDPVIRALTRCIADDVAEGFTPDLVVITGDLAFSGTAEEYGLARTWLGSKLWPALGGNLPRDRLLLVPGNHDVDRDKVRRGARFIQADLLQKRIQDEIAAVLGNDGDRSDMLERHAAYLDFVSEWLGEPQTLPWWERLIEIRGRRLHLAGLDSAWMACDDTDRGKLLLGRYQLTQTVETEQAEGADWRIALLHHPWDCLAEFDLEPSRSAIHQHCDLVLRGHLHQTRPERVSRPDPARGCLELAAGCLYESNDFPNAFQWIELTPAGKRVRVLFRAWLHNSWTIDRNQPGCPEGQADFDLGAPPPSARAAQRPAVPEIPSEYLEWLRRTCADVSLLGHDIQQGQAFTLNHVYVPALTQPRIRSMDEVPNVDEIENIDDIGKPIPLLRRLDEESLYVPAAAGAGKSTFCRWAVLQSVSGAAMTHPVPAPDEFAETEPTNLRGRLPLLAPLREFAAEMDCGRGRRTWSHAELEDALAGWIDRKRAPSLTGDRLKAHLDAGRVFLLLDGLDEVPSSDTHAGTTVYPRELLLSGLADALSEWHTRGNRILLTSRPYGLDEAGLHRLGLPSAPLEPLPEPLQELFITRWFHTLDKNDLASGLIETIGGRDDLAPLVENPMLLTALCVLYDSGGRLPEDRYELYRRIVNNVLHNRFPGDIREREPVKARLEAIALGMHTGDAESPRTNPAAEISHLEIERLLRDFAEEDWSYERQSVEPAARRDELLTRSGLLLPQPNQRASFYHLSFQEFLAAERILRTCDDLEPVFREHAAVAEWRPTLMFLLAGKIASKTPRWGSNLVSRLIADQDRAAVAGNAAPALFIAEALELYVSKHHPIPDALTDAFQRLSLQAIEDEIEVPARHALGLCLGRLGDERIFDLRDPDAYVEVPAGTYPYGEEGETVEIEMPFLIGRYPVTNSQYQLFMDDDGYGTRKWWSDAGWEWKEQEHLTEPDYWHNRHWNGPNQPLVGISFWEAEACANWAGGRLPMEQEWEAAARGPKGSEYPWGNDWQDGICNSWEAGLGMTSAVGLFPRSRQATLGLEDLAGNVWEWCDSFYEESDAGKGPDALHVRRGGSWGSDQRVLRSANRFRYLPFIRNSVVGFRLARTP